MAVKKKATDKHESGSASPPAAQTDLAVASGTAPKVGTPQPSAAKATSPKPATAKTAAAPVKLTERQLEFLKMIHGTKEPGFLVGRKADQRTIDALMDRKLIKKGAKDRESGNFRYSVSKAGEKHLTSSPPTA